MTQIVQFIKLSMYSYPFHSVDGRDPNTEVLGEPDSPAVELEAPATGPTVASAGLYLFCLIYNYYINLLHGRRYVIVYGC